MNPDYVNKVLSLRWRRLPPEVRDQAKRCLRDILAVATASLTLPAALKRQNLAKSRYGIGPAPLWFTGRSSTLSDSSLFNAAAVDSLDWHDGFRPVKGHACATVVPLVLGSCALRPVGGEELLTALVIGYEIACRAGLILHRLYHPAYHASGSADLLELVAAAPLTGGNS
jgi:2-methylcitrate dehydratase PrpD